MHCELVGQGLLYVQIWIIHTFISEWDPLLCFLCSNKSKKKASYNFWVNSYLAICSLVKMIMVQSDVYHSLHRGHKLPEQSHWDLYRHGKSLSFICGGCRRCFKTKLKWFCATESCFLFSHIYLFAVKTCFGSCSTYPKHTVKHIAS